MIMLNATVTPQLPAETAGLTTKNYKVFPISQQKTK
jgi:hypothetical protein